MKIFLTVLTFFLFLNSPVEAQQVPPPKDPATKALIQNAYNGDMAKVQISVKKGAAVDAVDANKRTALMWAAFRGHTAIVEYLYNQGANINARDSDGQTALMYATSSSHPQTVEFLIKNGAEVNAQSWKEGFTALITAAAMGDMQVVRLLLDNGADPDLKAKDGDTAASTARQYHQQAVVDLLESRPVSGDQP